MRELKCVIVFLCLFLHFFSNRFASYNSRVCINLNSLIFSLFPFNWKKYTYIFILFSLAVFGRSKFLRNCICVYMITHRYFVILFVKMVLFLIPFDYESDSLTIRPRLPQRNRTNWDRLNPDLAGTGRLYNFKLTLDKRCILVENDNRVDVSIWHQSYIDLMLDKNNKISRCVCLCKLCVVIAEALDNRSGQHALHGAHW